MNIIKLREYIKNRYFIRDIYVNMSNVTNFGLVDPDELAQLNLTRDGDEHEPYFEAITEINFGGEWILYVLETPEEITKIMTTPKSVLMGA